MTIQNPIAFVNGLWDWGFLDRCFGNTNIRVTDIDGMVERNGKFLLIETKQYGVDIPTGQRIMFDNWLALGQTLLVIWGKQGSRSYKVLFQTNRTKIEFDDATDIHIQLCVQLWFFTVNQRINL